VLQLTTNFRFLPDTAFLRLSQACGEHQPGDDDCTFHS
jgi:hypothetical protein